MSEIEKFLFNTSFDAAALTQDKANAKAVEEEAAKNEAEEIAQPTFSEEELEAAKRKAFETGKEEGILEAADAIETRISETLVAISERIQALFHQQTVVTTDLLDDATKTAIAVARKCFSHLTDTEAPKVIENMVQEVLSENLEEPRITIHLHTDLLEIMNNRMVKIAQAANFEGQVLVLEDDSITPGDCRVIWSSGSAERDMGALWQQIDEVVEKNLHAARLSLERLTTESLGQVEETGPMLPAEDMPIADQPPETEMPQQLTSSERVELSDISDGAQGFSKPDADESIEISTLDENKKEHSPSPVPSVAVDEVLVESEPASQDMDITGACLLAGPGIVEEPVDKGIMETLDDDETADKEPAAGDVEETDDSMPPTTPNT